MLLTLLEINRFIAILVSVFNLVDNALAAVLHRFELEPYLFSRQLQPSIQQIHLLIFADL